MLKRWPKIIAVNQPERVALLLSRPIGIIFKIFRPITVVINYIARITLQALRIQVRVTSTTHADRG